MLAWLVFSTHIALSELDPQWAESVPITMPEGHDEDSPQHAEHAREILLTPDHYDVAGWL